METIVEEKPLFTFSKLEALFDSTFNTLVKDKELLILSPTSSTLYLGKDNSNPLSAHFSEDDSPPTPQRLIKICHKSI